jgi:UDP-2-acetamido-2,6-beta-L-arabino-hexul-4-ose reductase
VKIAVTGPDGFIAWHTRCAIRARGGGDAVHLGREHFEDPTLMAKALVDVDAVVHLAGVNRAADEDTIRRVNPCLAEQLAAGLQLLDRPVPVVYGNSIHADGDSVFGVAKREAADILAEYGSAAGATVTDVVLPNIFGEWGRPFYNSVVATFSHQVARGESPRIEVDKDLPLLHVQRAADVLLAAAASPKGGRVDPQGTFLSVTEVLDRINAMAVSYRTGDLPDLGDPFTRDLFNTYRSYTFPAAWPIHPEVRGDQRGELFETVRAHGGESQVFFSTTRPGFTRGQHYHLHKVERFLVLQGCGVIRLRKLFTNEVVEFPVSGDRPAIVDMPTMWVHSITNTGTEDLLTLFYADELFDPEHPDTYAEEV